MTKYIRRTFPFVAVFVLASPLFAFAQSGINTAAITPYSNGILNVINNILVPLIIGVAFIVFLWGVFKYFILGAANEDDRREGRQFVLWGLIGFVVIISVWGLVALVSNTLGFSTGSATTNGLTPPTI